jgi:glycosyltransferase involved in cell wall biosynthesis
MKITGFSFVRNAINYDYPIVESITSLLPLVDEYVIAVGKSDDATLDLIKYIGSPKIKIIETVWDEAMRQGGAILAQQTNIALEHVRGDWAIYLQADEVLHEKDYPKLRAAMEQYADDRTIEGLLFNYLHFFGSYTYITDSRRWYKREVRIIRPGIGISSWGDAQGFRKDQRKLRVKPVDATIYHYGWVKPPDLQQAKQLHFSKLWHSDEWVNANIIQGAEFDYARGGKLAVFRGTHPMAMCERIKKQDWEYRYDPTKVRESSKVRILEWIERMSGKRLFEYKNYEVV